MKAFIYGCQDFEQTILQQTAEAFGVSLNLSAVNLSAQTAKLAEGFEVISLFANDDGSDDALQALQQQGTKFIALRCAGFNHVDITSAKALGICVARVPEYSPYSVAEHTAGLLLTLNRKLHRAWARVREQNFSLKGLMGFDLHGKTVGIIGLGKIGLCFARIMLGFGCKVLAYDPSESEEANRLGIQYVSLSELFAQSRIISLHCPLNEHSQHIINAASLAKMQRGAILLNTGRGALINSKDLIAAIKSGHIGAVGLDVYEQEAGVFFADRSGDILTDDLLARLMTFPNVFITGHQGFFTEEAVHNIAHTSLQNIVDYYQGRRTACWL